MSNNRIIRSPDVSVDSVTLNSRYSKEDFSDDSSQKVEPVITADSIKADQEIIEESKNIETLDELDLKALSDILKDKEKSIEAEKEALSKQREELEIKALNYKDSIYSDLKNELSKELMSENEELLNQLNQLISSISDKVNASITGVEDELVSIVYESVCKILGKKMLEDDGVYSVVKEVMKYTQDRMEMKLRVSERDFVILDKERNSLSSGISNRIDIIPDEHVRYGGCILETAAGRIDGRLEQQLKSLLDTLVNGRD